MKKRIEDCIRKYFRTNNFLCPDCFADFVLDGISIAKAVAKGYWDHRTDEEITRDEQSSVTLSQYEHWVVNELYLLKTADQKN